MEDAANGTITSIKNLQAIISTFPEEIDYAFGYGSGVFVQEENSINTNENAMIDLILSVSDPTAWHQKNIHSNPVHYAAIPKILGPSFISMVQSKGAGCYFNPMVHINVQDKETSRLVKYGVISQSRLKRDLMEWECLYVAGRMQKPILPLEMNKKGSETSDEILQLQENFNLKYALSTALLLLPQQSHFNPEEKQVKINYLFELIAGLSYIGDPRFTVGAEDPGKVSKLVNSNGQLERFLSMYEHQISNLEKEGVIGIGTGSSSNNSLSSTHKKFEQQFIEVDLNDVSTRRKLYENLPKNLQFYTQSFIVPSKNKSSDTSDAEIASFAKYLTTALGKIVGPPARIQSGKGVLTAGISKSFRYVGAKLAKGAFRKFQ